MPANTVNLFLLYAPYRPPPLAATVVYLYRVRLGHCATIFSDTVGSWVHPSGARKMSSTFKIGFDDAVHEKLIAKQDKFGREAHGNVDVTYEQEATKMLLLD